MSGTRTWRRHKSHRERQFLLLARNFRDLWNLTDCHRVRNKRNIGGIKAYWARLIQELAPLVQV